MSINITQLQVQQYANTIQLLLQQKGSKLAQAVMTGSHVGKQASPVDQIGAIAANRVTSRFAPMPRVDASVDRRWVFPVDYDVPQLLDTYDRLRLLNDPTSALVQSAMYSLGRAKDDEIIDAFFGNSKTGENASTTVSFGTTLTSSNGQNVAVAHGAAGATGLTVAKLIEAKRQLMANEVDLDSDPITAVITSKQHGNLLNEIQVVSKDFNETPVLVEGRVTRYLGINFLTCERLKTGTDDAAGTSTMVPMFSRSGMYLGMWNDIQASISQRNDIQGEPWQAYAKGTFGATRLEEKKIVRIWCR